jgi:cysteinyl-tRNA synthetase
VICGKPAPDLREDDPMTTPIRLYNTKTRSKEVFTPIDETDVRMYVCGPTVYDRAHLGNARPVVVFDVLYRLLREVYGPEHVTYVRNFTDVDDKINARAAESGRPISEITAETTQWFLDDMAEIGALQPSIRGGDHEKAMPRATGYIGPMVTMIEELIAGGHAYEAEGHVLFAVESYRDYGALSGRTVEDMIAGARVEVAPYKRNPMDFVLWKPSDDDQPGWESPWGRGRPGWHIECSAMAYELLGEHFDIHGGGNDLQFPHHENEIAQSKCAGHDFADVWMHNEMLQVEGKKMSKSLGNFFTVRDLLDQGVPGEVIRFVMLSTHYRKPMDWTLEKAAKAQTALKTWREMTRFVEPSDVPAELIAALADDLNTPLAISKIRELSQTDSSKLKASLIFLGFEMPDGGQPAKFETPASQLINELLEVRENLRAEKDYASADWLRDQIEGIGIIVADGGSGNRNSVNDTEKLAELTGSLDVAVHEAFVANEAKKLLEVVNERFVSN